MQIYSRVTGDKEIMAKLKILAAKCDSKLGTIVKNTTFKVVAEAKKAVPVITGRLRSSITQEIIDKPSEHTGTVGTNVEYAPKVEFGIGRKTAKPYLYPALMTGNQYMIKQLNNEIKKIKP